MTLPRTAVLFLFLAACSKTPDPGPTADPTAEPTPDEQTPDEPVPIDPPTERDSLTAEECEAQGGKVVGDIGDGAIHKPDYRCPDSGEPPIGDIAQEPSDEGPIAVEGSVCCAGSV